VARSYFEVLKAPIKGFYTFDHSAHSPILEEPGKVQKIVREDVLAGTNTLADEK
jgi:pimeloyl-ACP methyl ester carboxylesterase